MESRAKAFGHAVHPMLITFPLGLLATAVVFDVLYLVTGAGGFTGAAAYTIAAGVIGGVAAGAFGLADWLAIPKGTRARRVGAVHGLGNVAVLLLFAASWLLRVDPHGWTPPAAALLCGLAGAALAVFTAWLGGELVERLGVGVDDHAHINAPNSLSPHGK